MLSRLADSLYWMGRYVERAENVARFIDVNLNLMLDMPLDAPRQWRPLVVTTGDFADFERRFGEAGMESAVRFLVTDPENPNSILSCVGKARENARTMREVISSEMWETLNRFHLALRDEAGAAAPEFLAAFCRRVKEFSHLFCGVADATLSHGEAWHFLNLGRLFERADKTTRILDVKYFILLPKVEDVGTPYDDILWTALLKSASANEMYRKKHSQIHPSRVAEFLLLDEEFPRAVRHCLIRAEDSLRAVTGTPGGRWVNPAERLLGRLRSELDYANIWEIIAGGMHEYLDNLEAKLNSVGEALFAIFLSDLPPEAFDLTPQTERTDQ